jgi:glycerophosphoryl diester phosphodiesterase
MTYDEVSKFDFSYDDNDQVNDFSAYRGEKIPTFAEFIALCKELGLHPYIEIKGNMTEQEAIKLIDIVTDAGMTDSVSWLGFSGDALSKIAHNCPTARLVWVITDTNATKIKANNIPFAQMNLMTGQNQVVFDIWYTLATQDVVDLVSEYGIPLEVWTVNDVNAIRNLNPYVTGVSSDMYNAKQILNK